MHTGADVPNPSAYNSVSCDLLARSLSNPSYVKIRARCCLAVGQEPGDGAGMQGSLCKRRCTHCLTVEAFYSQSNTVGKQIAKDQLTCL